MCTINIYIYIYIHIYDVILPIMSLSFATPIHWHQHTPDTIAAAMALDGGLGGGHG